MQDPHDASKNKGCMFSAFYSVSNHMLSCKKEEIGWTKRIQKINFGGEFAPCGISWRWLKTCKAGCLIIKLVSPIKLHWSPNKQYRKYNKQREVIYEMFHKSMNCKQCSKNTRRINF